MMRQTEPFLDGWHFTKQALDGEVPHSVLGDPVALPHTWNAEDGQDGGNDYYRGKCWYTRRFSLSSLPADEEVWLEFRGVAMVAAVYVNGIHVCQHKGGYTTFRANITGAVQADNLIAVLADNGVRDDVHPQQGDFTFYGGIYRDVYLIRVPKAHFALEYYGGNALRIVPEVVESYATVSLDAWGENVPDGTPVHFAIQGCGSVTATMQDNHAQATMTIPNVHLWDGIQDPYLYTATASLGDGMDFTQARFGCRTLRFDAQEGFFLNGRSYPLCGAARHQDWPGVGSALTQDMHRQDMALFQEMGVNTIRLAHYPHDPYFYDLCDAAGILVWTEIPYCTMDSDNARDNALEQMRELIVQNHHHACVACWGLSNEITIATGITDALMETHRQLHALCHEMDKTRPTTTANVYLVETDSPFLSIPDIRSYNLYLGWYNGVPSDMDQWFDAFHAKNPEMVIGLSEYGADANPQYQTGVPVKGDYTEAYQALYHEHMLAMWQTRRFIWAMHAWIMFDFASDGRNEGGRKGVNQKGLVTFDRKVRKDAFYIYKAYLSKVPFVHICGRRYVDRTEDTTTVKVYSNLPKVTLFVDGKQVETQAGDKVFSFEVPITAAHTLRAEAGSCTDEIHIRKVKTPNPDYVLQSSAIVNWFEAGREDCYTVADKIGEICKSPEGKALVDALLASVRSKAGAAAGASGDGEAMNRMIYSISLERLLNQSGFPGAEKALAELNEKLGRIHRV